MPVDSNIALSVATPQIANPIDNYTKAVALKDMMTQDKLRQQQIAQSVIQTQSLQAQAQQHQRDLLDESNWTTAIKEAGGDFGKALDTLSKSGSVSGTFLMNKQNTVDKLITDKMARESSENTRDKAADDDIYNRILSVTALDPSQQPTQYANIMDAMMNDSKLGPRVQKGLQMGILQKSWPQESKPYMETLGMVKGGQGYINAQATQRAALAEQAAKAANEQANADKTRAGIPIVTAEAANAPTLYKANADEASHKADQSGKVLAGTSATGITAEQQEQNRNSRGELAVKQGELGLKKQELDRTFGDGAVDTWVDNILANPDLKLPAGKLGNAIEQQFTKKTGLPLPIPTTAPMRDRLVSANMALKAVQELREDLKDPDIQKRLGPILGRVGNAEQDTGATIGLSPQAAQKAARLRANMRYLFANELKTNIGARPSEFLAKQLESASPNVKLNDPMLLGTLQGVEDSALRTHDAVDQSRFGGKMRSRAQRGLTPSVTITPKFTSMDTVRAYAAEHQISEAQAKKHAEDEGYTVK